MVVCCCCCCWLLLFVVAFFFPLALPQLPCSSAATPGLALAIGPCKDSSPELKMETVAAASGAIGLTASLQQDSSCLCSHPLGHQGPRQQVPTAVHQRNRRACKVAPLEQGRSVHRAQLAVSAIILEQRPMPLLCSESAACKDAPMEHGTTFEPGPAAQLSRQLSH